MEEKQSSASPPTQPKAKQVRKGREGGDDMDGRGEKGR